jgi:uncharacterized protein (DUF952 family)
MDLIYKILPASLWRDAEESGFFDGTEAELAGGFVHFSTAEQIRETAQKYFAGQGGLLLIAADKNRLGKRSDLRLRVAARFFRISMQPCRSMPSSLQSPCLFCRTAGMILLGS